MATSALMSEVECPRCGAKMATGGVCPVCETPWAVSSAAGAAAHDAAPQSAAARWWRSGQLPLAVAAACFAGAMFLPLLGDVRIREGSSVTLGVSVRPLDLALGTISAIRGGMTAWFLPGAAAMLLSLLRSRRTGSQMMATRPLLFVVALAPIVSVAMPFALLRKHGLSPTPGAALALVALGVAMTIFAALRFGDGVADRARRLAAHDEDA